MTTKTRPMPVFDAAAARAQLGAARYEQALRDPRSVDLLTWNVFHTLETHYDQDWLAYLMQGLGGTGVGPPVRMQLWTGRDADPLLRPSRGYLAQVRERATEAGAGEEALADFRALIEVDVRIESPDVLCLVDAMMDTYERGTEGRDRLLELVDAGLEHSRRLSKILAVAIIHRSGSPGAKEVSARLNQLRGTLADELPHQRGAKRVELRDVGWQQLLRMWEKEVDYLEISGDPRAFIRHCREVGLY